MLDDGGTCPRAHKGRHGGDVDGVEPVPSRAHNVQGIPVNPQWTGVGEHGLHQPGHFGNRLTLGAQRNEEAGDLHVGGVSSHDRVHGPLGGILAEVFPGNQGRDQVWPRA